jgi:hypothetical protein
VAYIAPLFSFLRARRDMDLGTFGEDGGRRERKKRVAPDKPQQTSPEKRQVPDPGAVPVEIVCEKFGVGVRFQFRSESREARLAANESNWLEQRLGLERRGEDVHEH